MSKTAYVFFADGFEEIEALTPVDLLTRAGITIMRVGVTGEVVVSASGTRIITDVDVSAVPKDGMDVLVLPGGGEGAKNLASCDALVALIRHQMNAQKLIAAICIAPAIVLAPNGFLHNRTFTCYPGGEQMVRDTTARFVETAVVKDNNLITSRGVGTAASFASAIISELQGKEAARTVWNDTLQALHDGVMNTW